VATRVGARVRAAVESLDAERVLLVAKSLGTMAAPVARDLGLPAIWFTPVMTGAVGTDPAVFVDAVASRTAPALLVGGTADALWDGERARELSDHVLEVDGADHMMMVPGPLAGSLAVLATVVAAVERFLHDHL
jgi:pimeloyl-ACP methyl ester carboxylesterase